MDPRTRNILLVVLGAVLLIVCCCALVAGGALVYLIPFRTSMSGTGAPEQAVVVVTPMRERSPESSPEPVQQPTLEPTGIPGQPAEGTPQSRSGAPGAAITSTSASDTEVLLAQAEMPERDLRDLALRLKPEVGDIPLVVNPTPPSYEVGDEAQFWVENSDTQEHRQITATLRYKTDHVYMWVERGINLNEDDLKESADRFEASTYPTNREFFGSEWIPGVDNDMHLTILHARGLGQSIAGYYSSSDEFSHLINPYSNEREMFYISADRGRAEPNTPFYDGVLAHEFQHMIHWANDRNEDSWVNEGMSELAGHLNGFDTGGAEYAYAEKPDTQLTTWNDPSVGNAEHYGASYLFTAYFLERFGEELTKGVVASDENGMEGFNEPLAQAGRSERFDDVFADWLIANYLDLPNANPRGHFGYSDIDPPSPVLQDVYRRFPVTAQAEVSQYGADFVELRSNADLEINFTGSTTVGLVNTEPRGQYAWWSNRGDDSDATLTRGFDLRNLTTATLTFSTWYQIEDGWDYAYVEASTDGGKHWQILPGQHTTDRNPVGNAFGPGWTGVSGGGNTPQWVEERVDLSPFAGQQILLRFEYVTDDAVNEPGFMLDDIAIPELGYADGGESGQAGWEAAGWVLTDNNLNQRWLVQLVTLDQNTVQIQRMQVGPDGRGQLMLNDAAQIDSAVLVISALAPTTTERASYSYTISSR